VALAFHSLSVVHTVRTAL